MKRVMTIQDISCLGKCSLTVALPIISAMGIETAIVPTAVLSTHTQFSGFTFCDLTDQMEPIRSHWQKQGFTFEAIYTGYLGSERQISLVKDFIDTFGHGCSEIIVDPAMADNGRLYAGFNEHFAHEMKKLCGRADIILPNISEACLMLDEPYPGEDADEETVKKLLLELASIGAKTAVITGTTFADGSFGFMGFDTEKAEFFSYGTEKVPMKSHGTGDIFASAFTGALVQSCQVYPSLKLAADYTCACIKNSYMDPHHVNYAVNFESEIPHLLKKVENTVADK